jgi:predicted Zn-dependent protease
MIAQAKSNNPYRPIEDQFKLLGQKLDQNWQEWYWVYRVVERIARANGLDERPWRIGIMPYYDINAYATEINLVVAFRGILDQMHGDDAALACIMGHEMAHNQLRHQAKRFHINETLKAQFEQEAQAEIDKLVAEEQRKYEKWKQSQVAGGLLGGILGRVTGFNFTPFFLNDNGQLDRQKIEQKKKAIIAEKEKAYLASLNASIRTQEFEADKQGYLYMATAGYDPQGCIRAMEVLARTDHAEIDTTHPNVPARIDTLQRLMREYPATALAAQGTQKLRARPNPLSVDLVIKPHAHSESVVIPTVRINSKFGSS